MLERKIVSLFVGLLAVLGVFSSNASNLTATYDSEPTGVLPAKIRSPRFKNIYMSIGDKFDGAGVANPLGNALNKKLTWNDLVESQTDVVDKNLISGAVSNLGYSLGDSPGSSMGAVKTNVNVMVPVMSIGVTDKFTAAVAFPIYKVDIAAATGFERSEQGQSWANYLCGPNMVRCNDAAEKLRDPINQKLRRLGYKEIASESFQSLGDIKIVGKYLLSKDDVESWALKPVVTAPTGRGPDVDKALDITTGDGQWDVGSTLAYDRALGGRWLLNAYATVNLQLPDMIERRIPKAGNDSLSDEKEIVYRDSGDQFAMGVGALYGIPTRGWNYGLSLAYQYMNSTSFHGTQFSPERYTWLEAQYPLQDVYSLMLSANYSTIDYFKEQRFAVPLQGGLTWSRPLIGRNATTNDVVSAELVMFF